jgi:hypothetical protein
MADAYDFRADADALRKFRRDLKQLDAEADKELRDAMKGAGKLVAEEAGRLAPVGTRPIPRDRVPRKRLSQAYTAGTKGGRVVVRNRLPHAAIVEFRKTGTAAQLRNVAPIQRAAEKLADRVREEVGDGLERAAQRVGW